MELKPGYKQTEVGVIPEDWEVKKIGDLGDVVRGASPRPAGSRRYFNGSFISWLTVAALTNIPDYQLEVTETSSFLTEKGSKQSRTLPSGTLIIANSGATLGIAKILTLTCCANDGIAAIINQRLGEKRFVSFYINSQTKRLREVVATGNGQPNLNTGLISDIPIPFPSFIEQEAISTVLSDTDSLIESLEQLISKKRLIKQGAMQELLTGKRRLPGFAQKSGYKQTEVGGIPEDWEIKRLWEVADIISGGTPRTTEPTYWNGGIQWCTPTDITGCHGKYLFETERTISSAGLNSSGTRLLPKGSLLLCSRATVGEVRISANIVCTNQGFKALVCKPGINNEYLYYKVLTMKPLMIERAFGSTFLEISKKNVSALELAVPNFQEQSAIVSVLSDMDEEITSLEEKLSKLRQIKQGMMQELLTGRIRLV